MASTKAEKFKEKWITSFMKNLEERLDEKRRTELMIACGRDCARREAIGMAKSCKGDVDALVKKLARILGKDNCRRQKDQVHLTYTKCFCKLVNKGPARLPDAYCICSQGWVMEMFETAAQKPVKVQILQTIKRGAPSCKFVASL
jgi:hypothetical protein